MLFSSGEPLPFHHYEHLNQDFVSYLLDEGEDPANPDAGEEILDSAVTTILAFNLHFLDAASNLVMQVLAQKGTVKSFTEKIMALMNSGGEPFSISISLTLLASRLSPNSQLSHAH
jgi:hypothetical protein